MTSNMKEDNFLSKEGNSSLNNDEIDLKQFLNFCFRNKKIIGLATLITFIFSIFYFLTLKKVWAGQFQIVIKSQSENNSFLASLNPSLQRFAGLNGSSNSNLTEVEILKSPSVLMPVFEFVNSSKKIKNEKSDLIFSDWLNDNLEIELINRTSILNITYKDTDKEIILPVLERMTKSYQNYSTMSKRRNQELAKDFLEKQLVLFKEKSSQSLKDAQSYAIDKDLLFDNQSLNSGLQGSLQNTGIGLFGDDLSSIYQRGINTSPSSDNSFEQIRIKSANEIKKIDLQLEAIKDIGDDSEKIQVVGLDIPSLARDGLPLELARLERAIVFYQSKYTDEDITLKRLIDQRDLLKEEIKKNAIGYLNAKKTVAKAKMESAKRPKDVLLKYKDLMRKARRDELTLINLEEKLGIIKLEEARREDPWKLITKPTLLLDEVSPQKSQILLTGLLMGYLIGSGIAYYLENKKGYIFNKKKLQNYCGTSIIQELCVEEIYPSSEKIIFLSDYLNSKSIKSLNVINFDVTQNRYLDDLNNAISQINAKVKISEITSLNQLNSSFSSEMTFLITKLGFLEYKKLESLNKRLATFNIKLAGIILINS